MCVLSLQNKNGVKTHLLKLKTSKISRGGEAPTGAFISVLKADFLERGGEGMIEMHNTPDLKLIITFLFKELKMVNHCFVIGCTAWHSNL